MYMSVSYPNSPFVLDSRGMRIQKEFRIEEGIKKNHAALAFRYWEIQPNISLLASYGVDSFWKSGTNIAECLYYSEKHKAPHSDCRCGFNCFSGLPSDESLQNYEGGIWGAILIGGNVEIHNGGYRSEIAQIIALYRPKELQVKPGPNKYFNKLLNLSPEYILPETPDEEVASSYNVPIFYNREDLEKYCLHFPTGDKDETYEAAFSKDSVDKADRVTAQTLEPSRSFSSRPFRAKLAKTKKDPEDYFSNALGVLTGFLLLFLLFLMVAVGWGSVKHDGFIDGWKKDTEELSASFTTAQEDFYTEYGEYSDSVTELSDTNPELGDKIAEYDGDNLQLSIRNRTEDGKEVSEITTLAETTVTGLGIPILTRKYLQADITEGEAGKTEGLDGEYEIDVNDGDYEKK